MKKKRTEPPVIRRARLPKHTELLAVVGEMSGGSRFKALCEDGKTRMIRIGGRFKRRMWVRPNDLIIVKEWTIQSDEKADLVYRYLPAERMWMIRNNKIPEVINIWKK